MNLLLLPPTVAVISWVLFATEEIGAPERAGFEMEPNEPVDDAPCNVRLQSSSLAGHIIEEPFGRALADNAAEDRLTPFGTLWDPQVRRY